MPTIIVSVLGLFAAYRFTRFMHRFYQNDPRIWSRSIKKFAVEDKSNPPAGNAVLFVGSSSIRFWQTLKQDMSPFPVINRGFGGSMIHQIIHYAGRIVLPYKPKAIFFYAGENDITGILFTKKHGAGQIRDSYQHFCSLVHTEFPGTPIYFISIKPPKARIRHWEEMRRANQLIADYCDTDKRLHYVDIVPAMLDKEGKARRDFFRADGIHMNEAGYAAWTGQIRPLVASLFAEPEQPVLAEAS